ncbi:MULTISPECIES: hypothetical protein [Streptomyces]|uniref:Uncharacterized protein n=1 Tax=Streptomyces sviceus (strain ATCC 29083 / DSM 924 / JCM 4929 / NBRC 13980 / NCIMB 11184 / NRRL 5439 / UC 5370) TaxID=463191 RepID=B5I3W1_STRX2|nr:MULTISPECIES: hypothetical protein [Streptomyces]EDY59766.1 conserved hypothetical protein [Streptomyces sviceus ATCC 29083]MYT03904.1 hypothetical protein [Streptomyces sp. SID5470]
MAYRRAVIPALVGGLLITLLLWWAGASAQALQLRGSTSVFDVDSVNELRRWLTPWSYDPSTALPSDGSVGTGTDGGGGGTRYSELYRTAMQIRFVTLFAFFVAGALLLLRRMPPTQGRTPATLLALWAWGPVAATLAVTVSAPWLIASRGRGSYRVLPQLAGVIASSGPVAVFAGLATALLTVVVARVTAKGAVPLPRRSVPPRAARTAAGVGTAVVAVSLVVLSYQSVAAWIQTSFSGAGLLSEPGDLLRQWLLLGAWSGPSTMSFGHWLLYRAADVVLLAVVWWSLRLLPGLLTRTTAPAMVLGAVCATVLGLLASQVLHMAVDDTAAVWGPVHVFSALGTGVPAALTFGVMSGLAALATLRLAGDRDPLPSAVVPA